MALTAQNIAIDPTLKNTLAGTGAGTNAYNKIQQGYGQAQTNFGADASARGMNGGAATGAGSYYGTQAPISQGLAVGGPENALGGGLANTSYQNALQQRDFGQNEQLAEQAANLNKPDLLQQILGGVGAITPTAATIYGMNKGKPSSYATASGPGTAYNINNPGNLDLGYQW